MRVCKQHDLLCPERRVYTSQEGLCGELSAVHPVSINVTISRCGDACDLGGEIFQPAFPTRAWAGAGPQAPGSSFGPVGRQGSSTVMFCAFFQDFVRQLEA